MLLELLVVDLRFGVLFERHLFPNLPAEHSSGALGLQGLAKSTPASATCFLIAAIAPSISFASAVIFLARELLHQPPVND